MLRNAVPSLLRQVRRLAAAESSDEQLLADFLARRSDDAFAALIGRHGPMVLNVCRRILHDAHAAEDVFQATFLVLADRAGSIRQRASLAGFLHGVAYRLAVRARRRRMQPLPTSVCDQGEGPAEGLAWQEMLAILDHELGQLSDRYRAPLVLCYLEGRTQDEAARQLGWSLNTLRRRLEQGRRLLEARLRGRGVTLPAALAGLLAGGAVAVPGRLRAATLAEISARANGRCTASANILPSSRKGITFFLSASYKKIGALVALAVLGVAAAFGYWTRQADQAPPRRPTIEAPAGDPLPARATVRLGTARYRHGSQINCLAVSADGGLAAVTGAWNSFTPARVFDLSDGRCLYSLPFAQGSGIEAVGLSPDGKTLAIKDSKFLSFHDAATGKERSKIAYLLPSGGGRSITSWLTFTPDGKQLAATLMGSSIQLIDVATGDIKRTFDREQAAAACVFSPDGKWLAAGGYEHDKKVYFARLWEVATGKEVRRFEIGKELNHRIGALAFSPDGTMLAGGSWREGRLHLFEVASGKKLKVFPRIGNEIHSVAFAPDGKTVAAAGDNIHLYDLVTGKDRLQIEQQALGLAFSPDGSVLTGAVRGAIYRWDTASGRQLTPAAGQDTGVDQVLISAISGRLFTIDQDGHLYAWDPTQGKPPRLIAGEVERGAVASPDGRFLAWTGKGKYGGSQIRLYDIAADRFIDRFPVFSDTASVEGFLPDGKTIVTLNRDTKVRLWAVDSGKERRSFLAKSTKKLTPIDRPLNFLHANRRAALSPDGKTLVIADMDRGLPVTLYDLATGQARHELDVRMTSVNAAADAVDPVSYLGFGGRRLIGYLSSGNGVTFSPDSRLVVTWSENPFKSSATDHVTVWDAATGRAVANLGSDPPAGAGCVAFAPDGRTLATASANGLIRLWEVATWKVRAEFRGHRDRITALAFAPDGRLFTGGLDTTVLGWDVQPPPAPARGTLAEAWQALAEADARVAFQAQGRFLAEPGKAVEWIVARLTPVRQPSPARVKALIADLDAADFATRERATADLREYGLVVAAALRAFVANSSSAEARRRAAGILKELANGVTPAREFQALRAVEVLEWIATKEARACLRELAKGAPQSRLTREAAAASRRLEGRK
jgi:RNA polymerase sigma factor (sigma-70 family)